MVENHAYERQNVDRAFAFRRRVCAVLNDDLAVVHERLLDILSGCAAFEPVDCAFNSVKDGAHEVAQEFVYVDVVNLELRSVVTEQTACVDIHAFPFSGVVCRHAFCVVTTENLGCKSCLFGISGVDFRLKFDGEFRLAAGKIDFFCKQRFECREHLGIEIFGEEIGDESAERAYHVVDRHFLLFEVESERNFAVESEEGIFFRAFVYDVVEGFFTVLTSGVVFVAIFEKSGILIGAD